MTDNKNKFVYFGPSTAKKVMMVTPSTEYVKYEIIFNDGSGMKLLFSDSTVEIYVETNSGESNSDNNRYTFRVVIVFISKDETLMKCDPNSIVCIQLGEYTFDALHTKCVSSDGLFHFEYRFSVQNGIGFKFGTVPNLAMIKSNTKTKSDCPSRPIKSKRNFLDDSDLDEETRKNTILNSVLRCPLKRHC